MNEDCLKLTMYFGERDRCGPRLLADELLDTYGRHGVETSVLLRGIEGFGLEHHLHTDRVLTLSEDLPAVAVAVDTRVRIQALLPELAALRRRGLVTLERARLLTGGIGSVVLPEALHEATKLTIYIGRRQRIGRAPAFVAICGLLHSRGVAGATVLLGVDGTRHGARARAGFLSRNADVPLLVTAVGDGERIAGVLPELGVLLGPAPITVERVRVCKRDGRRLARPHALPGTDASGLAIWQQLMIYSSESARHGRHPLHRELIHRLRRANVAGATSVRGIWGFHGDHAPHGDRLLQVHRHVPVVTTVVDTPDRIATAFAIVDEVTEASGLVTSEMVPAMAAVAEHEQRGGLRLAEHDF